MTKPGRADLDVQWRVVGQMGAGGWVQMDLFWATFIGLMVRAVSRLFAPR